MLFDLRGRGRRRTVQVIYLGLALLFLLGFVGFGIGGVGGAGGGGFLSALTGENGSSGASYADQVAKAMKSTRLKPNDPAAWAALAEAQLHQASEAAYYEQAGERYTAKGKELLNEVAHSWSTYLALEKSNPSPTLANQMAARVFSELGLNQPAQVVQALQIVIAAEPPSAALYGRLARYSYQAHNTRVGDLASTKAVSLAPAVDRKRIKKELEEIKSNPSLTSGSSSSALPKGTYTTTQGGKTYTVKPGPNGTLTGQASTAPAPAGKTSTAKK